MEISGSGGSFNSEMQRVNQELISDSLLGPGSGISGDRRGI